MNGTSRIPVAALAVVFFVGAACGGDDGVSKDDYLARAKEVCQEGNQALTKASNEVFAKVPPGQKLSPEELENFVRTTVIPTVRDQIKRLRALEAPKDDKAHVEEIYGALDKGLDELEKTPAKLTDGSNVFAEADTLAQKYGISVCAATG
ncbi:MAG TPA: hypothetical protein VEG38_03325 [Acidimicrobiia bacterium]|nr:hypothetical protein [Acidimicrobiia bacterium]